MSESALIGELPSDTATPTQTLAQSENTIQPEADSFSALFRQYAGTAVEISRTERSKNVGNLTVHSFKASLSDAALRSEAIKAFRRHALQNGMDVYVVLSRKEVFPVSELLGAVNKSCPKLYINLATRGDRHFIHSYTLRRFTKLDPRP